MQRKKNRSTSEILSNENDTRNKILLLSMWITIWIGILLTYKKTTALHSFWNVVSRSYEHPLILEDLFNRESLKNLLMHLSKSVGISSNFGLWTFVILFNCFLVMLAGSKLLRKYKTRDAWKSNSNVNSPEVCEDLGDILDVDFDATSSSDASSDYNPMDYVGQDVTYVQELLTNEQYTNEAENHTRRNLVTLWKSQEFRELVSSREKDDSAFNWQKRRTLGKGTPQRIGRKEFERENNEVET